MSRQPSVILLDGEGVVWCGGNSIPGAAATIADMRAAEFRVVLVTNNASRSSAQYVQRLASGGFTGFVERDVVTSAVAVSRYLVANGYANPERKIFVIGTDGFCTELRDVGLTVLTAADFDGLDLYDMELDVDVSAVVVGTSEEFDYRHVAIATRFVVENDALLISSNEDGSYPHNRRVLVPGPYALAKCIGTASAREPLVLGKPNPDFFATIDGIQAIPKTQIWMVGDRLNTDIRFAKNTGIRSVLVLTGVSHREDVQLLAAEDRPDFVCADLAQAFLTIKENF
jgi:phosphoglycolate/pyridoxal phosphate phosphatase family enzyme